MAIVKDVAARVKEIIIEHLGVDDDEVTPSATFDDDLGADSLDSVELVMGLEEAFGIDIPEPEWVKLKTVADAIAYVERRVAGK